MSAGSRRVRFHLFRAKMRENDFRFSRSNSRLAVVTLHDVNGIEYLLRSVYIVVITIDGHIVVVIRRTCDSSCYDNNSIFIKRIRVGSQLV